MAADMDTSKKPYVIAICIQLIYAGMFVASKAAFDHGLNTYVFVFYRQFAGSLLLLPVAFFLYRKNVGSVSPWIFWKLFLCAFLGITFGLNLYSVCLKFTSATVASATDNSIPVITFFVALLLRMEDVKLRSWSGLAKLAGVALSLAGVLVIAFYAGPSLSPVNHHRAFPSHASSAGSAAAPVARGASWVKWTLLMVVANVAWSLWIVFQAAVLKECPDRILVTTSQCVFGTVQSFVVAVIAESDFSRWNLRFDVSLLSILYNGFVGIGACYYLQAWCMQMKGPVFQISWTPLCFVFTMFCSSFLGEMVHLGSIVGGILLVGGLYFVIWGKSKEPMVAPADNDEVNKNGSNIPQHDHSDSAEERKDKMERKAQSASAPADVEEQV